ncbi:MAG: MmgE/PrpD family protein [Pseudomonadota bacterium]
MNETKELVKHCFELSWETFSNDVIDKVKYLTLDFLGVASRGSLSDSSQVMYAFLKELALDPEGSYVIGSDWRAMPQYAALANGTSAHSLELDDVVNEASLHPAVAIFPAAFSASYLTKGPVKTFMEGVVLGYEVMIRLGKALDPSAHYAQGFHPTGTCGTMGAAITAAKILGLDYNQMLNALGIAGSQAAGSMEFLADGSWTKRMHPGWAAHSGLIAALLAKKGYTGPSSIIEGKAGFLHAYSPKSDPGKVLANWGHPFEIMKTSIKPHSCCRYIQAPIDGILKITKENGIKAEEVEKVTLGILKTAFPIIVEPKELKYAPRSVVDAQFSMPFGAAVAIMDGKATLDEFVQEKVESKAVKELMNKVECVQDPELDKDFPKTWPATVEIRTKDGKTYKSYIEYPKGDPENPLSWDELIAKFHTLTAPVYSDKRRNYIVARVRELKSEDSLDTLCSLFQKDK